MEVTFLPPEPEPEPEPTPEPLPAPTPPPTPTPYLRTTEAQESERPPEDPRFISDRDTMAAAELPAEGLEELPTQDGIDEEFLELQDQALQLAPDQPAAPTPPVPETPELVAQPTPRPLEPEEVETEPTPDPEALALLSPTPTPTPTPEVEREPEREPDPQPTPLPTPDRSRPPVDPGGFSPHSERTRISGNISSRGIGALDAEATPLGRYKRILSEAIGSRWYYYVDSRMGLMTIGTVKVAFVVDAGGRIGAVDIVSNTANETLATYTIRSVLEAELPPIPEDVVNILDNQRLEVDFSFTIYGR